VLIFLVTPTVVVLDDLGNVGSGDSKTASVTIPVIVRPTNHAPTVTVPAAFAATEDQLLSLAGILVSDQDMGDAVTVSVTVSAGSLVQLTPQQLGRFTEELRAYHQHRFLHRDTTGMTPVFLSIILPL
jgi:hypothetical protein